MKDGLIYTVFDYSKKVDNGRTLSDIMLHLTTEIGELSQEIIINNGKSYKEEGKDGIIGEAIDVINCALDIIFIKNSAISEEEILNIVKNKCEKWVEMEKLKALR